MIRVVLAAAMWSAPAGAQRTAAAGQCDRVGTTAITYGRSGGSIQPAVLRLNPDGSVSQRGSGAEFASTGHSVSRDAVAAMARLAWLGGFTRLPTSPTRPTRNPDAARDFIEIHSACGHKHVEYAAGDGAPAFRELLALLHAVTP